ncbi:hypothetical protein INR49_030517 [Caranx melampygus]|nr:hypothetical protein INR49_030517 [Caranx melampygus]
MSPESAPSSSQSTPGFHQLSWNARCQPLPPPSPIRYKTDTSTSISGLHGPTVVALTNFDHCARPRANKPPMTKRRPLSTAPQPASTTRKEDIHQDRKLKRG